MKVNAKSVIKFTIRQENKLLSIIENLESKNLAITDKNVFKELRRITEKNINLLERDYNGLAERLQTLPITTLILDDFNIDVPKNKNLDYQTNLIFIMKIIDSFCRLFEILIRKCTDNLLHKMLEELVKEKMQLRQKIEAIYDKIIA